MLEEEFLSGIPETWQGQTFRLNFATEEGSNMITFLFCGTNNQQTMIGCCIELQNVLAKSIIEKYKKEFPGLTVRERSVPRMRLIIMSSQQVRIQIALIQPGNFVSIFIADQKYMNFYRNIIQESAQKASQKALDF